MQTLHIHGLTAVMIATLAGMFALSSLVAAENILPDTVISDYRTGWEGHHAGWELGNVRLMDDEDVPYLRFVADKPAVINFEVPIQEGWKALKLSVESRRSGIRAGGNPWNVPATELTFRVPGESSLVRPRTLFGRNDTGGWETMEHTYDIPEGAVMVVVRFSFWHGGAGTADFRNLRVTPVDGN